MEIKKLEMLIESIEMGSFTKVADKMGITQSAITQAIHSLEREMGFPLLVRTHNGVLPTKEAKSLLPSIKMLLFHAEQIDLQAGAIRERRKESIRVSAYSSVIVSWMPYIIRNFNIQYPNVSVELSSSNIDDTYSAVRNGAVDLAFASRQDYPDCDFIHLYDDPFMAILPERKEYRDLKVLPIKYFQDTDFIMPYYGCEKDLNIFFEREGVKPNIQATHVDDLSLMYMVENNMGVSILSELMMQGNRNHIIALPLEPRASREMVICMKNRKSLSEIATRFVDIACSTVAELCRSTT